MQYDGSISPPRQPPEKKHIIPRRRRSLEEEMGTSGGDKEAVERAMKEAAGNLLWPMLTRSNYQEWFALVQCNLEGMYL